MFNLTIREAIINTKRGTSRRTNQPYAIHEQPAIVELPNGERRAITIQHEQHDDAPLKAGSYKPSETAGYVGRFGSLEVSTRARHWEPVEAKTAQASASKQ